jgi:hypothetical protein
VEADRPNQEGDCDVSHLEDLRLANSNGFFAGHWEALARIVLFFDWNPFQSTAADDGEVVASATKNCGVPCRHF